MNVTVIKPVLVHGALVAIGLLAGMLGTYADNHRVGTGASESDQWKTPERATPESDTVSARILSEHAS